jgi:hypothetical protein
MCCNIRSWSLVAGCDALLYCCGAARGVVARCAEVDDLISFSSFSSLLLFSYCVLSDSTNAAPRENVDSGLTCVVRRKSVRDTECV